MLNLNFITGNTDIPVGTYRESNCTPVGSDTFTSFNCNSQSSVLNYVDLKQNYSMKDSENINYTKIETLINFKYSLKKPINVKLIKNINGDVIGDIEDLELYSFGKDEFEVLRELNEELTSLFEDLVDIDNKNLGEYPKKWKRILKNYLNVL